MQRLKDLLWTVCLKANNTAIVKSENMLIISPEYVQNVKNSGTFIIYLTYLYRSMNSTIMQNLTVTTFMVSEKIRMLKVFHKPRHFAHQKHVNDLPKYQSHKPYCVWSFHVCSNHTMLTIEDKNPKQAICSLCFWQTCDLEIRSISSNLARQYKAWAML